MILLTHRPLTHPIIPMISYLQHQWLDTLLFRHAFQNLNLLLRRFLWGVHLWCTTLPMFSCRLQFLHLLLQTILLLSLILQSRCQTLLVWYGHCYPLLLWPILQLTTSPTLQLLRQHIVMLMRLPLHYGIPIFTSRPVHHCNSRSLCQTLQRMLQWAPPLLYPYHYLVFNLRIIRQRSWNQMNRPYVSHVL